MTCHVMTHGTQVPHQETPRASSASSQYIATKTDMQRWCRRAAALDERGPARTGIAMHCDTEGCIAPAWTAHRFRGIGVRGVSNVRVFSFSLREKVARRAG